MLHCIRPRFLVLPAAAAFLLLTPSSASQISSADEPTWNSIAKHFEVPEKFRGDLGEYRSPLKFYDGREVKTPEDWQKRRQEIRGRWMSMLGPWPELITDPKVIELKRERREKITQIRVRFDWAPNQTTHGYLLIPDGEGKRPAIVTVFYESGLLEHCPSKTLGNRRELKGGETEALDEGGGVVPGGGLTVIANAPNPAGQSILKRYFSHGVSPACLFKTALLPTVIMALCFLLLRF